MTNREAYEQIKKKFPCAIGNDCDVTTIAGKAFKALEEQDRWIPVSERLPKNEVEVQICTRKEYRGKYHYIITSAHHQDGTMHTEESKWSWVDCDFDYCEETDDWIISEGWWEERHYNPNDVYNNLVDDEVIAWMPLPESYKGE